MTMSIDIDKRALLKKLTIATALLPASSTLWAQQKLSKNPFTLGVASGSATHDAVVLWTRLYDQGVFSSNIPNEIIPVKWEISKDEAFAQVVQSGVSQATPDLAHSVHVELSGLPSNQWFFYRFQVGEFTSATGKTRTFAAHNAPADKLKIAFASCQHYELGYFNAYPHVVAEKPDVLLFLGDYIYEYAPGKKGVRTVEGSWCLTLADYRKRYATYKQEKELQEVHACCPWLVTWDDHEVQNDYAGTQEGSMGPSTNFLKRRAAAYQAYYEHMPLKASVLTEGIAGLDKGAEMRIYDNYKFGSLLSLSMLDTRQYRSPQACTPNGKTGSGVLDPKSCELLSDQSRSMLGLQQEQWLEKQLQDGKDHAWNLIGQSTLFGQILLSYADGPKIWNDGWDGYPVTRSRITQQLVKHKVPNPVILGGDVHESWVGYVKEDYGSPASKAVGVEFCGASISSYEGRNTSVRQKRNPHFVFSEGLRMGYTVMEFNKNELNVAIRAVKDHRQKTSEIETLAKFRVPAGAPKIEVQPL
jgi:alkaline phosphatase D